MTAHAARPLIPNDQARRLFLARQCLAEPPRGRQSAADLLALITRMGFVQVDSINTVARAHDMILFARNQTYQPPRLKHLLEIDRALFENWTHDASIIPTAFYPFWRRRFVRDAASIRERWARWRREGFAEMLDDILAHVENHGPSMSRHLGAGEKKSNGGWWDWHPSKTALEYLWRTGDLSISGRDGFQKVYDLTSRVLPAHHAAAVPEAGAYVDWACSSALARLGFATSGEIAAFWGLVSPGEAAAWCASQPADLLIEVDIANADGADGADGAKPRKAFARPDLPDLARAAPPAPSRVRILSPFDPALRDRKRTARLFGFDYRIEVFVPAAKRQYGYYVFPILERDRLIGRIDMKRDRDSGTLNVTGLWLEPGVKRSRQRMAKLDAELDRYRRFAGCTAVVWRGGRG
ncbi:MAG: winged helix-turn-helix domain-containing protein [Alphaproteobacteria bacterium]